MALFIIQDCKAEYSKNLLPINSSYNGTNTWLITGGSAAENSSEIVYSGQKSLKITAPHSFNTIICSTATDIYSAFKTGKYVFGFRVYENSITTLANNFAVKVNFFKNNVFYKSEKYNTYEQNFLGQLDYKQNTWNTFSTILDMQINDILTWSFELDNEITQPKTSYFYFDGLKLEYDDRKLNGQPTYYTEPV